MKEDRLKILLYNAITMLEESDKFYYCDSDSHENLLEELGMTEEEYQEVMKDDE